MVLSAPVAVKFSSAPATVNTADIHVIFPAVSRWEGLPVTKEQFDRERRYGAAMAVARAMLSKGIITEDDYKKVEVAFTEKYRPLIGPLIPISP